MTNKIDNENKIIWYDTLTEVLNMGFDLDKNSARDLLSCTNELIRINENKPKYEFYSTGGGFWVAQYTENGYLWAVTNDMPYCLTKYINEEDKVFYEEGIIFSIDTKTEKFPHKKDEKIYKRLYKMLEKEGIIE